MSDPSHQRDVHPAALSVEQLLQDCEVKRTRGSGPGGQHRNKVETAIVIKHLPTEVIGQASERRRQEDNRKEAINRLRVNLAISCRCPIDNIQSYQPSDLWKARVKGKQISIGESHADFPAILAEAMDVLVACSLDSGKSAEVLGCSSSQLIKLLKKDRAAMDWVNRQRTANDLSVYR